MWDFDGSGGDGALTTLIDDADTDPSIERRPSHGVDITTDVSIVGWVQWKVSCGDCGGDMVDDEERRTSPHGDWFDGRSDKFVDGNKRVGVASIIMNCNGVVKHDIELR